MNRFFRTLAFKIGAIIIVAEILVLSAVGFVYVNRFSREVDRRIEAQVQTPGALMNAGLLNLDTVADRNTMESLVGKGIEEAMVVGINHNIFFSLDPNYLGKNIEEVSVLDPTLIEGVTAQHTMIRDEGSVISISPIFAVDGRTPQFYVYLKVSTAEADLEKARLSRLFFLGSAATVLLTFVIIIASFHFTILLRLSGVLKILKRVEGGDLSARTTGKIARDEIGLLQLGVDSMTTQLELTIAELKWRVGQLQQARDEIASLYKSQNRQLKLTQNLREVGALLTTRMSLEQVFERVFDLLAEVVKYDSVSVQLLNNEEGIDLIAGRGYVDFKHAQEVARIVAGKTLEERFGKQKIMVIPDTYADPRWIPGMGQEYIHSWIGAALLVREELVGILNVDSATPNAYNEETGKIVLAFANQAAIAIENARLFDAAQREIKDRKLAEKELKRHQEHLEELVRARTLELRNAKEKAEVANQAKSMFLANISHELRTPLNSILGYAQLINRKDADADLTQQGLEIIHRSGEHLLTLINDLLDIARIEAGRVELVLAPLNLPTFLETVAGIIRARAEAKRLTFVFDAPNLPIWIQADETRLRQILLNLLGNAVKFTSFGSVSLRVTGSRSNDKINVRFEVEDSGVGIAPEDQERLFQPFEQAGDLHRRAEGTGLGLAISRQLARLMGSDLHVESPSPRARQKEEQGGPGSLFWFEVVFELAGAFMEIQSGLTRERAVKGYRGPRRKVLIVDDVPANRALLIGVLRPLGFETFEAADGLVGFRLAQEIRPDIILMDRWMPNMNGLATAQKLKSDETLSNIPIIAISASAAPEDREASRRAGYDAFLPKPIVVHDLLAALEKTVNLEWVYEEIEPETKDMIPPPPEEIKALLDLATKGDLQAIQDRSSHIKTLGERYVPFANKLLQLARSFEEKKLRAFLEECTENKDN